MSNLKQILDECNKEKFCEIINNNTNITDIFAVSGYKNYNGKHLKILNEKIEEYGLNKNHFVNQNSKYKIINKICPYCSNSFTTQKNHKKEKTVCSIKCSAFFFSAKRHSLESNLKIAKTMTKEFKKEKSLFNIVCEFCNKNHLSSKKTTRFCGPKCVTNNRIKNGTHNGWASRSKINPSYPEQYVISIFEFCNIELPKRELKVGKWFIDFPETINKIALEIDGKQHDLPERKISDKNKDEYLKSEGWQVIRVRWKKPTFNFRNKLINIIKIFFDENNYKSFIK